MGQAAPDHEKRIDSIESQFRILKKCKGKLDCLIYETLFIRVLKSKLNKQSDSIRAKMFIESILFLRFKRRTVVAFNSDEFNSY